MGGAENKRFEITCRHAPLPLLNHDDMPNNTLSRHLIVYADDDPDDLYLVKEVFEKHAPAVQVLTFPDGLEVLTYLLAIAEGQATPCLVVLDINMPRLNGKEVLLELRKANRFEKTPVVLFTTSSQPQDKDFARQHNIGFLTKPTNYNDMQAIVRTFLQHCDEDVAAGIR